MKIRIILSVLLAGAALREDLKNGKVPNPLILTGLGAAFIICLCRALSFSVGTAFADAAPLSVYGFPDMICGALFPLLFPGMLFFFRMIGAGDVKLLCALGAILGLAASRTLVIRSLGLGAIQALLLLLIRGNGSERWHVMKEYFLSCIRSGKLLPYTDRSPSGRMHLTASIFGAVAWYALENRLLSR